MDRAAYTQSYEQQYLRGMQITDHRTQKKSTNTFTVCVAVGAPLSNLLWEPVKNLTNSTDAKTKTLMEKMVNLHLPRLHQRLTPFPPFSPVLFLCWLAGYSENIEWKALSIQPVSHLGKGIWMGRASLASGFDPRVLWQSRGLRNPDRLFHRPVSTSTHTFMASPHPLHGIHLISNIYCMCLPAEMHSCFFHPERRQTKKAISPWSSSHAVLLFDFIRYIKLPLRLFVGVLLAISPKDYFV